MVNAIIYGSIIGAMLLFIVIVNIVANRHWSNSDLPEYKVSMDQMIAVVSTLMVEIHLSPMEKETLHQLIDLLESWKEEESSEEE